MWGGDPGSNARGEEKRSAGSGGGKVRGWENRVGGGETIGAWASDISQAWPGGRAGIDVDS